jgi:hypothetical protein
MCTLVETPDLKVLLDAGVSLCPYRFSLPPHPLEFQTMANFRRKIAEAADKAEVITISHYHFDHHTPSFEDWLVNWTETTETARQIYHNKTVLMKNPKENINASQRQRAWMFEKTGGAYAKRLEAADGKVFTFGSTVLRFSEAVVHGSDSAMLGWILMLVVECDDERFMFAPDIQGPMSKHTRDLIEAENPAAIMLGGPPLYLEGSRVDPSVIEQSLRNLESIVRKVPTVILEHHVLRYETWKQKVIKVLEAASEVGHNVLTSAEFCGEKNSFLESTRKQLYEDFPVSEEFKRWMKTLNNKKIEKPPLQPPNNAKDKNEQAPRNRR